MTPIFRSHTRPSLDWLSDAVCAEHPDPDAFVIHPSWQSPESSRRTLKALLACRMCPVIEDCLSFVRPNQTHFDGIAGGKVWKEGKHYPPPKPTTAEEVAADVIYRHGRSIMRKGTFR